MGVFTIGDGRTHLDSGGLRQLADEAEREGIRNVRTLTERWSVGTERFDRVGENVLVALAGDIVGVGGLSQCPTVEGALRMRRFYVSPGWRRHGIGRALASDLIGSGLAHADLLTCNAAASDAAPPFWESMGFVPVAVDGITHVLTRT